MIVDDSAREDDAPEEVGTTISTDDMVPEENVSTSNTEVAGPSANSVVEEPHVANKGPSLRIQKDHSKELIIGNPRQGVVTRLRESVSNVCFVSKFKPKNVKEALTDEFWINAMQD